LRVLQLAPYASAHGGSFVPMLGAVVDSAMRRGWRAEILLPAAARERDWIGLLAERGADLHFSTAGTRRGRTLEVARLLASRERGGTVLHSHFTEFDIPAALAAGRGDPVFWHLHTPPADRSSVRVRNALKFRIFGRRASRILCVAPHMVERLAPLAPRGKLQFIPNGIDVSAFSPPRPAERAAARRELGLPPDGPVLLHFGWNWRIKGGDRFLEAVGLLRDAGLDVHAVTRSDEPETFELRDRLGLSDRVHVVDYVERVQALYHAADVLVSSSRLEGMPFAVLEALCCGVPVAASEIPGHVLIARDLDGCRVVPGVPEALAGAVRDLLYADRDELAAQTGRARQRIADTMDLGDWGERVFGLYEESLENGAGARLPGRPV
jgi:glycosyltransferase involved in cell wall biosynthesis